MSLKAFFCQVVPNIIFPIIILRTVCFILALDVYIALGK